MPDIALRFRVLIATLSLVLLPTAVAVAQTNDDAVSADAAASTETVQALVADAGDDINVLVGRKVLFDGSATTGPDGATIRYSWDFGDGTYATGIDATHTYTGSGIYRVTLTTEADKQESESEIFVSVQDNLVVLITDQSVSADTINQLKELARIQGTQIVVIRDKGVDQEYLTVQNLAQQMIESNTDIAAANTIITWTAGNVGLNSLIELGRVTALNGTDLNAFRFNTKAIVVINDSVVSSANIAQSTYQAVKPQYIVLSDRNILDDVLVAKSPDQLLKNLAGVDTSYQIINEYTARSLGQLTPFNFMSFMLNYMINHGVPINSLYLILVLPVLATVIAASRQLIGIKAFGIFAPSVIGLSFLATGIKYGVTVFIAIIVIGTLARMSARKLRLLYLPRMAIVLSLVALALFAMFLVGAATNRTGFVAISIFPILIMTVLAEHFISVQITQGHKAAIKLTIETLILSLIGYFIGDWTVFKTTILAYPELVLLTFVINYVIGKFSGLRLTEYIRFQSLIKHLKNVEKSR